MSATAHLSTISLDDSTMVEVWAPAVTPKSPWRLTIKKRPGTNMPHTLTSVRGYDSEEAATEAFNNLKAQLRPQQPISARNRKARKR